MPEEKKFNPKKDLPHKVIEKQISKITKKTILKI